MLKGQFFIRKDALFVRFQGELDQHSIEKIRVKVSELITNYHVKYLIINCLDLTFMDSSGIGFIIGRYNQLKENNGKVILCELNDLIEKIVRVSGISRITTIKNTENDATMYVEGLNGKIYANVI